MSYRNAGRHRHTKGVVLFTVVAIMLFLLIMIASTLSVVSSAQRRTYTKFKENQAYFTARSGIDGFLIAASNETEGGKNQLYKDFYDLCKNGTIVKSSEVPTIDDLEGNSNVMKAEVECPQPDQSGGQLEYLFGTCKIYAHKTSDYSGRIVSHVVLDDCESTVYLYIEWDPPAPELFKNALTSFEGTTSAIGMSIYGGSSYEIVGTNRNPSSSTYDYRNSGKVVRSAAYGSGISLNSSPTFIFQDTVPELKKDSDGNYYYQNGSSQYNGFAVMGDLTVNNNIQVQGYNESGKKPYFYVDGYLNFVSSGCEIGTDFNGNMSTDDENKVNIYCNRLNMGNSGNKFNGDLTIYNATSTSDEISVFAEQSPDACGNSYFNGQIDGDIYCDGDLELGQNAVVNGNIYCSGELTFNNRDTSCVSGTFVGGTVIDKNGADITADHQYSEMPDSFKTKDEVRGEANNDEEYTPGIITLPTSNADNYVKVNEDNTPSGEEGLYPAFGYYKDENDEWKERTEPDPTWTKLGNLFPMNANGQTYVIDASENPQKIVVDGVLFGDNVNNNKIVIKGDKKVEFYFTNTAQLWTGGSRGNMIVTEKFYDNMFNGNNQYMTSPGEDNLMLNTYFYVQDGATLNLEGTMIMAYMYGPNAKVTMNNGVEIYNTYYDGVNIGSNKTNFIGSVVFSEIEGSNNNGGYFLPPEKDEPSPDEPEKFWRDSYYSNH